MPPHLPSKPQTLSLLIIVLSLSILFIYSLHPSSSYCSSQNTPTRLSSSSSRNASASSLFLSLTHFPSANSTIASHLRALTLAPHLAGTPAAAPPAAYVLSHFRSYGLQTLIRHYTPLLSYPLSSSLSLLHPNLSLVRTLALLEPADPLSKAGVPPYHAYSPSGSAVAAPIFANLGRDEDYKLLNALGVTVGGKVVILRNGDGPRGAVVANAAEHGAKVVLMFTDRTDGGVERGTVRAGAVGDPLTPGWAAANGERLAWDDEEVTRSLPRIPSMPVSAETAAEILRGMSGPAVPGEWKSGAAAEAGGVGGGNLLLNFTYQEDRRLATIQNVFGVIKGSEEPDRYVILGNHRDAWTYGAVDPNSGTAVLLDIARRYGVLLRSGWRPRRTIFLCSWDAEEFGMIGSTEWVEQNIGNLGSNAVAYINVDCAVQGPGFFAAATPQLDKLLIDITKQISDPDMEGMTVYQTWVTANAGINIERLARSDSDFSAFLHHVGVPSVDLYYGKEFPGYHTALDAYEWMEKYIDPLFHRHVAISEIWGLLGLHLADDPVLAFDYLSYATQLQDHTDALKVLLDGGESIEPIAASVNEFMAAAYAAQEEAKALREKATKEGSAELRQRSYNDRIMLVERGFLEAEGLIGRPWFKHLLYSPPEDYESKLSFFPGIADAISRARRRKMGRKEGEALVQHEIWRVARAIQRAAAVLRGELN